MDYVHWNCWSVGVPIDPKTTQPLSIALSHSLQVGTRDTTYRETHGRVMAALIWKSHPRWLALTVLEGAVHSTEENNKSNQWSCSTISPKSSNNDHLGEMSTLVQQCTNVAGADRFAIRFKICSIPLSSGTTALTEPRTQEPCSLSYRPRGRNNYYYSTKWRCHRSTNTHLYTQTLKSPLLSWKRHLLPSGDESRDCNWSECRE